MFDGFSLVNWELRDPWFLLAGFLAPLVYSMAVRIPSALTYSSLSLPNAAPRSLRVRLAPLPALLLTVATLFLAIALAGPRIGDETSQVKRKGIAIIMAIDRSGSMDARDFVEGDYSVSRLAALKQLFRDFVEGGKIGSGRANDLIGIVSFGTFADSVSPLTLDHANLLAIMDQMEVANERSEAATAIGEGLGLAVERLRLFEEGFDSSIHSKIIILLSDGVNNAGNLEPLQAAELAAAHTIQVYTIAAGTSGYVPVPIPTPDGRVRLVRQWMEVDEKGLQAIAERTGGRFFHAQDAKALEETYRAIDRLERREITEIRYVQYHEYFSFFVGLALLSIAAAGLLSGSFLRRLP